MSFFHDVFNDTGAAYALATGLLASLACGLVGPYVVVRRIVFISGAIAHIVVGGLGAAVFLQYSFPGAFGWLKPMYGAVISAVAAATIIGILRGRVRERMDTLIGAMWAVGMAVGVLLLSFVEAAEHGSDAGHAHHHPPVMDLLFGGTGPRDLVFVLILNAVIVLTIALFHKRLLALCLDEEYAWIQGVNVELTFIVLLILVALTVVALIHLVGVILVIALLTMPAATAGHYVGRLGSMMVVSVILGAVLTTAGQALTHGSPYGAGPVIILLAAGVYLVSVVYVRLRARAPAPPPPPGPGADLDATPPAA